MIRICESKFPLKNNIGFGVIAVFLYSGDDDPNEILNNAINKYTEGSNIDYTILMDAYLNCPWIRVIITNVKDMAEITLQQLKRDMRLKSLGI